jgi:hypothetical protein
MRKSHRRAGGGSSRTAVRRVKSRATTNQSPASGPIELAADLEVTDREGGVGLARRLEQRRVGTGEYVAGQPNGNVRDAGFNDEPRDATQKQNPPIR